MLPDSFLTRIIVRGAIVALDAVPYLALIHSIVAYFAYPAPPSVALTLSLAPQHAADFLFQHKLFFNFIFLWLAFEVFWLPIAKLVAISIDRGIWDTKQDERITPEERWRLFVKMLESSQDPEEWIKSFFLMPGKKSAPTGADDPAIEGVDMAKVGRTNIEEFLAYFMFNGGDLKKMKPKTIERAELNAMVGLLETTFTLSLPSGSPPFKFLRGRSPHKVFCLNRERLALGHKPLIFYAFTWLASQGGCIMLYLAGFRYFGQRTTWPLPLYCSSPSSLESVHDAHEHSKMRSSTQLSSRTSYWFKPARGLAQEEDQRPLIFCHGISGTYGPSCFIAAIAYLTGRAIFVPIHPYLTMRLASPSSILTRLEYTASIRRMLWRHGFGLTCLEPDEDDPEDIQDEEEEEPKKKGEEKEGEEEWRRGKAIVVAHSAGAGMAGWLMRDAPDIVAGLVLIDPMSFLLYCPDSARNFYRTKARTAGEHFFKYFASERGINHFLSRHVLWSASTLFSPNSVSPLPVEIKRAVVPKCARWTQEAGYDVPRYAAEINGLDDKKGAFPTVIFLSDKDCILPVPKLLKYFSRSRFGKIVQGETPSRLRPHPSTTTKASHSNGTATKTSNEIVKKESTTGGEGGSIILMLGLEHAAILNRWDWTKEVCRAIDEVGKKAEEWEDRERKDLYL